MFITPKDPLIICNYNHELEVATPDAPLLDSVGEMNDDDLRRVKDSGATVIMHQSYWHTAQPVLGGPIDWSIMDRKVEKTRALGMKSILTLPTSFPQENIPVEWWPMSPQGVRFGDYWTLWSPDAQEAEANFLQAAVDHFRSDDVQIILHELGGGEQKLHQGCDFFDKLAINDFMKRFGRAPETVPSSPEDVSWVRDRSIGHTMRMQDVLRKQHNEVWTAWHLFFAMRSNAGLYVDELFDSFSSTWPGINICFIQYTYFGHLSWIEPRIDGIISKGIKFFGEADHPRGLPRTTPYAINHKWEGQVCGPIHPAGGMNTRVTDEQVAQIAKSMQTWYAHRGIQ
jgi:hypothetical protein